MFTADIYFKAKIIKNKECYRMSQEKFNRNSNNSVTNKEL